MTPLIRCMGGSYCNHQVETCTATAVEHGRPEFVPVHRPPVWLSSEDVKQAIRDLADAGADKAVCWDMNAAINRLIAASTKEGE